MSPTIISKSLHCWLHNLMTQSYFWQTSFYLANKVLQLKIPVVTLTRLHEKSNMNDVQPSTGVSTQEEADTLIMLHAAEISKAGKNVHIMTQDTDVMVLALRRLRVLGLKKLCLWEQVTTEGELC